MKTKLLLIIIILIALQIKAQQNSRICGSDQVNKELMEKDPSFKNRVDAFDLKLATENITGKIIGSGSNIIYEIPVVIHVMYDESLVGTIINKTDAELVEWINYSNSIYQGTAPGYVGPGTGGTKIPIRFALAKRDPNCNPTTGIVRVNAGAVYPNYIINGVKYPPSTTGYATTTEGMLRSLSRWNPKYYYNIYIVNQIDNTPYVGYAYYAGVSEVYDGAFMTFGSVSTNKDTFAHEMGHAMGLIHTFGDADYQGGVCSINTGDCLVDNDKVCDTEYSTSSYNIYPCLTNSTLNTCTSQPYQGVQFNVMNYTRCPDRFTDGQRDRAVSQMLQFRMDLVNAITSEPIVSSNPSVVTACVPTTISTSGNYGAGPCNIIFKDINYYSVGNSFGSEFYIDHTNEGCFSSTISTNLTVGEPTNLSVSIAIYNQSIKAFIDYNNNGIFDLPSELVMDTNVTVSDEIGNATVIAPPTAILNTPLRMRVIADIGSIVSSCGNLNYGQTEDFSVTISPFLGTNNSVKLENILTIYPNPAKTLLTVQNNHQTPFEKIVITDLTGKIVLTQTAPTSQVNVAALANGLYILTAFSGEEQWVSKFVKE